MLKLSSISADLSWSPPVAWLPRQLLQPRHPVEAIIVGWLAAFVPSILLAIGVGQLLPPTAQPHITITSPAVLFLFVIAAPAIETLIMGGILALLLKFLSPTTAVLVSAVCWGAAHSLAAPAWGFVIWWPFLIFSTLYVTWRRRSLWAALSVPAATHALQNLLPSLLLLAGVDAVG